MIATLNAPSAPPRIRDKPLWLDPDAANRVVWSVTNETGVTTHDQILELDLGSVTPAADARVYLQGETGIIRAAPKVNTGINNMRRLPHYVNGSTLIVKAIGAWPNNETRNVILYYNGGEADSFTHLTNSGTTMKRSGPDTANNAFWDGELDLPRGATNLFDPTGRSMGIEVLRYNVFGVAGTHVANSFASTSATNREAELLESGAFSTDDENSSGTSEWGGTYSIRYRHHAALLPRFDDSEDEEKAWVTARITLTFTAQEEIRPLTAKGLGVFWLASGETNSTNGQLPMWFKQPEGSVTQYTSGAFPALTVGESGTIFGFSASTNVRCFQLLSATFTGFGSSLDSETFAMQDVFGRVYADLVGDTQNIPEGASLELSLLALWHEPTSDRVMTPTQAAEAMTYA